MNSKQVKSNAMLIYALALCVTSGRALADPTRPARSLEPSITVRLADLNFATPEGVRVAYGRIQSAAQQVCGASFALLHADRWIAWRECSRATVEVMVNRVDRPALSAFHRANMKSSRDLAATSASNISR
jgi:UrcA family protein